MVSRGDGNTGRGVVGRMSEILVTGGNGFVGHHLVKALQDRGDRVRVLALPTEDVSELEAGGVGVYRGDVRIAETLMAPMKDVDLVLHLAAMMDVLKPLDSYRAVNVTGTVNVCRAALAAGVRRLVHMSSSSVYGMGLGTVADEDSPLRPFADPYPLTKAEGDLAVQWMMKEHDLPAVIARPDQIFGPGDHLHFGQMAERLRSGRGIVVGSGHNSMPFVYVSDVVDGLLLALDHPRADGEIYNLTNDERMTQQQIMEAIAQDIHARVPRIHVPYLPLYAMGWAAERGAALRGSSKRPLLTRLGVAFFGTDNRYSIAKARRDLGYTPRVPIREGLRLAADWYLQSRSAATNASINAGTPTARMTN
jgi:nucleoside-diphosphate-sugar epimerase